MKTLSEWRRLANQSQIKFESAKSARVRLEKQLLNAQEELVACEEASRIAQEAAQHVQKTAHAQIAQLVSKCLTGVFGEDAYQFTIDFEKKRGKTEAVLGLCREGHNYSPDDAGGGVADVLALALRISCLMIHKPPLRKLLVLDEPLKHLSKEHRPAARALIEQLSEQLGIQFVIVTHDPLFELGIVHRFTKGVTT